MLCASRLHSTRHGKAGFFNQRPSPSLAVGYELSLFRAVSQLPYVGEAYTLRACAGIPRVPAGGQGHQPGVSVTGARTFPSLFVVLACGAVAVLCWSSRAMVCEKNRAPWSVPTARSRHKFARNSSCVRQKNTRRVVVTGHDEGRVAWLHGGLQHGHHAA